MATERDTSKSSWWSNHHHHPSNHLLELQKEIKEEEEEIFADINSLINGRSNLYSGLDDCEDEENHANNPKEKDFLPTTYIRPIITTTTTTAAAATTTTTTTPSTIFTERDEEEEAESRTPIATTTNTIASSNTTTTTGTTTITSSSSATTINNNIHLRSYQSRLDEQLFFSDDAAADDKDEPQQRHSLQNNYKTIASSQGANNKITITRDYKSNLGLDEDDDDDEASQDMDHHFRIDSGPPPEEIDFMHQEHYLDESMVENHNLTNLENDPDDHFTDGHKFSVCNSTSHQAFQAVIQHVTSNLPKPCVFFLEGNCRRSDCKYSHDLSTITCKYWIEGFCFKGELCPFLHSYNPQLDPSDPDCLDEDGLRLLARKELNPTFAIESEADFPSLPLDAPASALNDSTKSSNNTDSLTSTIKDQILSSNPAVVFKTVKKKRKRG